MERVLITGGAGFVGTTLALHLSGKCEIYIMDNLFRKGTERNLEMLKELKNVKFINGDIRKESDFERIPEVDTVFHCAAQTAVTTSMKDPRLDFEINALGTFNTLEFARKHDSSFIYCSTNKVYGDNVNKVPIRDTGKRYDFANEFSGKGIPHHFSIDTHEHTPYGTSKLTGEKYTREYHAVYGLKTVVNRMSCIYGTNQYGNEDQGWVAHFVISSVMDRPIRIYGDGKQVRDILWGRDLARLFELEALNINKVAGEIFNVGGGYSNTISLLELLEILKNLRGKDITYTFHEWRPADQKVYYSDISKPKELLGWEPQVSKEEGVKMLHDWVVENKRFWS
ncbi:MAG: nucleoside-diphosphate sugar epimerase [Candidatus Aenigmatarchaeota archaeon]|nr:MAG: nucleoside-diphosphate sugar epimerase [Candidatus Aenigmarchaeota archaeon]